mgnify:CR=1 FL=1
MKRIGNLVITDENGIREMDTQQCVHCGGHWIVVQGSKRQHRYCSKCDGNTCSNLDCLMNCIPAEKKLEIMERGV